MYKRLMLATLVTALLASGAEAQQPKPALTLPYETPIKSQLTDIFTRLADHVKAADTIAGRLRQVAAQQPIDVQREVNAAADNIGKLADALAPNGQLVTQLTALRAAAALHRKRVEEAKDTLEEGDRGKIMEAWDGILVEADKAQAAVVDMHTKLVAALQRLRKRQGAIAELMLAGQFQAAIASLNAWIAELQQTVNGLHQSIDLIGTDPRAHAA